MYILTIFDKLDRKLHLSKFPFVNMIIQHETSIYASMSYTTLFAKSFLLLFMNMLRCMCRYIKSDKIKNDDIQDKVRVTTVVDKMTEERLW